MFKIKASDGKNNICGARLAEIRKAQNLSQRALAKKMQLLGYDVDHYFIRRVENGERFVTDIDLQIFCAALDIGLSDIFSPTLEE
ncbi:MAG: helix-turn-helix transcriptional regulator [Clostridia bacterium]|nr:helix-turn-helix transcriptional regulator [Clostridia bacterium]